MHSNRYIITIIVYARELSLQKWFAKSTLWNFFRRTISYFQIGFCITRGQRFYVHRRVVDVNSFWGNPYKNDAHFLLGNFFLPNAITKS